MLLDLCITLLLEKLQSVFDSEDFGTIAQKNSTFKKALEHTMKKQWTIHVKNPLKHCRWQKLWIFMGLLRQENVDVRTCYI